MKRKLLTILLIATGLIFICYPYVSNYLMKYQQSVSIEDYQKTVKQLDKDQIKKELQKAYEYNDSLSGSVIRDPFIQGSGYTIPENYFSIINIDDVMGYIEVPKIKVYLPIYHGTEEIVLKKGVGHMKETAFPIGGIGNHSVLTGHRGLSSAKLFTDLDELKIGDHFFVHVLGETVAYKVDQIKVTNPHNTLYLQPENGKDYITLMTCTPYGVNSHRLLIRGERFPYQKDEVPHQEKSKDLLTKAGIAICALLAIILLIIRIYVNRRRKT
ncbi:class C sortase [Amedibacillus sp. YH-ame6]